MLILAALLFVQTAPAPCSAMDASLPASLASWGIRGKELTPGGGAIMLRTLSSADTGMMTIYQPGEAQPGHVEWKFSVTKAGRYGIAIDSAAWVDVVADSGGSPLKSVAHGHGPECSTIRKIVRFDLTPGTYELRLSKLTEGMSKVMLVEGE